MVEGNASSTFLLRLKAQEQSAAFTVEKSKVPLTLLLTAVRPIARAAQTYRRPRPTYPRALGVRPPWPLCVARVGAWHTTDHRRTASVAGCSPKAKARLRDGRIGVGTQAAEAASTTLAPTSMQPPVDRAWLGCVAGCHAGTCAHVIPALPRLSTAARPELTSSRRTETAFPSCRVGRLCARRSSSCKPWSVGQRRRVQRGLRVRILVSLRHPIIKGRSQVKPDLAFC